MKKNVNTSVLIEKQNLIRRQVVSQYTDYRKMRNLTQNELAQAMGVQRPNISRFEAGKCNPTLDMLVRMAECMDLDLRIELIGQREDTDYE